ARNHFLYFYPLFYFKLALVLLMGSWLLAALRFIKRKDDLFIAASLITVMAVAMALLAVRNLPIFGYLLLPLVSFNLRILFADRKVGGGAYLLAFFGIVLVFASLFLTKAAYWPRLKDSGLGLKKGVASAANFYLQHNIQGPILNNFNIGGYLIYYLYPAHRPFVDNRPEAYPEDFFNNTYLRLQEDEAFWGQAQEKYGFNVIFYSSFPIDNATKIFLSRRIFDPRWAVVYADDYAVILLKRNNLNRGIIARYELAKEIVPVKEGTP
ncbi:MAG: hypothetical protein PHW54_05095, partial [Candidatus Omnitrophica bacterium]|nr:hypothetical protein [Candidatus Omnitrophota bacterium]